MCRMRVCRTKAQRLQILGLPPTAPTSCPSIGPTIDMTILLAKQSGRCSVREGQRQSVCAPDAHTRDSNALG